MTRSQRLVFGSLMLSALGCLVVAGSAGPGELPAPAGTLITAGGFFAFSIAHACWGLGGQRALAFFGIAFLGSLAFELVGTATGWVYGAYHYTDQLGWKVFDQVPLMIPVGWCAMLYPCHVLGGALVRADGPRPGRGRVLPRSALAALAMTAWDLALDPVAVASSFWVWPGGGAYFGVPLHNFAGWWATAFTLYLLHHGAQRLLPPAERPALAPTFAALPLVAYGLVVLTTSWVAFRYGLRGPGLVGCLGAGGLLLGALGARSVGAWAPVLGRKGLAGRRTENREDPLL